MTLPFNKNPFYTWLFIAFLIFLTNNLCAQTKIIDSLKKVLPSLKDTARIDCLNELGSEFSDRYWSKSKYQQTDTAYIYTMLAMNESQAFALQERHR